MGTLLWITSQLLEMPHTGQIYVIFGCSMELEYIPPPIKSSHQTCLSFRFLCFLCCQVESNCKKLQCTWENTTCRYEFHRPQTQMYKMKLSFYFTPFYGLKAETSTSLVKDQCNQLYFLDFFKVNIVKMSVLTPHCFSPL